ncbi:unnamed protein product [Chironomus riparius]|uniref:Uncharacterized protein n=1 Tax=Chironomus riparius TaxID=315576 RepID=A0A9N9WYC4_9DIPT|nr:unnamed protein product [Chironomus riparius]
MMMEMGMNRILRKIAGAFSTITQLTKSGDEYSLNTIIVFYKTSQTFKAGQGKNVTTSDGRKVLNIFEIHGNKLLEKQIGEKTFIVEREFFDDQLIVKAGFENGSLCTCWCKVVSS